MTLAFDESAPLAPRGTVVVLVGRGEHPAVYERLGRRLAVDAYRVRVVAGHSDDEVLATARQTLGLDPLRPVVLLGSDEGAARATRLAGDLTADALVLGGLVPDGAGDVRFTEWDDELAARTSCPAHRGKLDADGELERGAYATAVAGEIDTALALPVLAVHGTADVVVPLDTVTPTLERFADAEIITVHDGVHDVFNDIVHRSVAASVVLFLERIRAGGTPIVSRVRTADVPVG